MAIEFPFRFNQQYQPGSIPQFGSFGPANISSMLQSSISKLADPMIARLKELELANDANKMKKAFLGTAAASAPAAAATPAPGDAQSKGVLGTPAAPFVNPAASAGSAGGSFALGQGMDPSSAEPTEGGVGTVRPSSMLEAGKIGIAGVETSGRPDAYTAKGPDVVRAGGRIDNAWGKYQVMGDNIGPWTEKHLGRRMTKEEFLASSEAQERVFEGEFGSYLDQYGNLRDAASKWFTGQPLKQATARGANDRYTTVPAYIQQMEGHIKRAYAGGAPEPQAAPTASFAPPVTPAPTPAATAAVGAPGGAPAVSGGNPAYPLPRREGPQPGGPNTAPQQAAFTAPELGGGQRPVAPEVAPRRVQTQALGPDGQPLPPGQQPAAPLPSGQPPNPQPQPPPPPPVQPPPPAIPAVVPVAPPAQARADVALPSNVPAEYMTLQTPTASPSPAPPSRVAPAATVLPPQQVAAGVPLPQAPARMPQQQQVAPQQQQQRVISPVDPAAERFLLQALSVAKTPEDVMKIGQELIKLRQGEKPSIHITPDGRVLEYSPGSRTTRELDSGGKAAPTVDIEVSPGVKRRFQWNPKSQRYDIPVGGDTGPIEDPKAWEKAKDLREKFDAEPETRKYRTAQTALHSVRSSAESGTGVGDLSLIYSYIKMLDPDTGVREGELALASQTGSLSDRVVNTYNNILNGQKLSDKQRKQFVDEASRLLVVRSKGVQEHVDWVTGAARRAKLNPEDVIRFRPHQHEPWTPPAGRDDPGGTDPELAANAPGSREDLPVNLGADWDLAKKNARTPGLSGKWGRWPDGSVTQLR